MLWPFISWCCTFQEWRMLAFYLDVLQTFVTRKVLRPFISWCCKFQEWRMLAFYLAVVQTLVTRKVLWPFISWCCTFQEWRMLAFLSWCIADSCHEKGVTAFHLVVLYISRVAYAGVLSWCSADFLSRERCYGLSSRGVVNFKSGVCWRFTLLYCRLLSRERCDRPFISWCYKFQEWRLLTFYLVVALTLTTRMALCQLYLVVL